VAVEFRWQLPGALAVSLQELRPRPSVPRPLGNTYHDLISSIQVSAFRIVREMSIASARSGLAKERQLAGPQTGQLATGSESSYRVSTSCATVRRAAAARSLSTRV